MQPAQGDVVVLRRDLGAGAQFRPLLGGSWLVISRVISRITRVITHNRGLITPLIPTPEPPSTSRDGTLTLNPKATPSPTPMHPIFRTPLESECHPLPGGFWSCGPTSNHKPKT